jgi:hypothetical protein
MPDNATGCPLQTRHEQAAPVHLQRQTRQQSRQDEQLCQDHRTSLRPLHAPCAPSAAPLMQPSLQPSALFPHRMFQDPRSFLLGRFANAGRCRANAKRSTPTRIRKPSPYPPFEVWPSPRRSFSKAVVDRYCSISAATRSALRQGKPPFRRSAEKTDTDMTKSWDEA